MSEHIRLTVLLRPTEYAELKRRAGRVPLSTWMRTELLETNHGPSEDQDVRPVADVPMVERSAPESERPRALPRKSPAKVSARTPKRNAGSSKCPHGFLIVDGVTSCPRCSKAAA